MYGGRVVAGARPSPRIGRLRLAAWLTRVKQRRQVAMTRHLELVEQTERLERAKRRSGAYSPELESRRRCL